MKMLYLNKCLLVLLLFLNLTDLTKCYSCPLLFKVGIVADVQYCDTENRGTRHYRASKKKLQEAVNTFNEEKVDFIINLGDLIDHDYDSYLPLMEIFSQSSAPVYHVLGNHDFSVAEDKKNEITKLLGLKRKYYTRKHFNWRFIFLDGTEVSVYANKKDSPEYTKASLTLDSLKLSKAVNAWDWNGAIGNKQIKWYKANLKKAEEKNENVIVVCHFPVFPQPDTYNLYNSNEIKNITEQFKGKLIYLHGHTHKSNFTDNNSVFYLSFRGMVETDMNSYAVAEVFSESILIRGFGKEKNYTIKWK